VPASALEAAELGAMSAAISLRQSGGRKFQDDISHLQLPDRLSFSANLHALQDNGSLRLHQKTPEILLAHEESNTAAEVRPSTRRDARPLIGSTT
jgi:hypothetical protein